MTLLNTLTASGSASLSDTTSLTGSYSNYEIVFENIIPATNGVSLELQFQVSGTFQTSGYVTMIAGGTSSAGFVSSVPTTYIPLSISTNAYNAAPGTSGRLRIYNPSASAIIQVSGDVAEAANASAVNVLT